MPYLATDGLCTLADVKAALRTAPADTVDDDRISLAIEAASRAIEARCNRYFHQDALPTPRRFVCTDPFLVEVDDISTTVGLLVKADSAGDGTFETVWTPADYQLEPVNGIRAGIGGWPFTKVRAVRSLYFPVWGGIAYPRPYTQALVEVTARWGWATIPVPVVKACVVQAISLFRADDTPFGATPFAESGIVRMRTALHPTAELLIEPYSEEPVLIG